MNDEAARTVTLASGTRMSAFGLGTWQLTGDAAVEGVGHALELGYRLIDTADDYYNQAQIGEALRSSSVRREDVFLTSKVEEVEDAYAATEDRLEQLGADRLDLCLIHRPPPTGAGEELWRGLIQAREKGLTRDIGVSNYSPAEIDRLIEATGELPAVNQVEWSPFGHSNELLAHAREHGIVIQAYSPLTRGDRLGDEILGELATRHGKTPAQVLLRWALQKGTPPIPKAADAGHRAENIDVFDFALDDDQMRTLDARNERYSSLAGLPYV